MSLTKRNEHKYSNLIKIGNVPAPIGEDTPPPPLPPPNPTGMTLRINSLTMLLALLVLVTLIGALVIGSTTLGLFLSFRAETSSHLVILDATTASTATLADNIGTLGVGVYEGETSNTFHFRNIAPGPHTTVTLDGNNNIVIDAIGSGSAPSADNVGTLGVGVYRDITSDTYHFRNVAQGTYTTVALDGNNNIIVDVNPSTLGSIEIITSTGLMGGATIPLGGSATLSLTAAQSFSMLGVSGTTMLGTMTSCIQPLSPSCLDISNQACSTPILPSCFPPTLNFNSSYIGTLTVENLVVLNMTTGIDVIVNGGNVSNVFDNIYVVDEFLTGTMTCNGLGQISQGCLNLGGYSCPLGVPLADSCIPASIVFYNESVTNLLSVNQVECLGGPLSDACVGGTSLATPGTLVRRNSSAGFATSSITVNALANSDWLSPVTIGIAQPSPTPSGVFYFLGTQSSPSPQQFYSYDVSTGTSTLIASLSVTPIHECISFTPMGVLFASLVNGSVATISLVDGTATIVCSPGVGGVIAMYDETHAYSFSAVGTGFQDLSLYRSDFGACTRTLIQSTGLLQSAGFQLCNNLAGSPLAVYFRGKLYTYVTANGGTGCTQIATLDPSLAPNAVMHVLNPNVNINVINRFNGLSIFCDQNGYPLLALTGSFVGDTIPEIGYFDLYTGILVGNSGLISEPGTGLGLGLPNLGAAVSYCNIQNIPLVEAATLRGDVNMYNNSITHVLQLQTESIKAYNATLSIVNSTLNLQGYVPTITWNQQSNLYAPTRGSLQTTSLFFVTPPVTTNGAVTALVGSPQLNITTTGSSVGAVGLLGKNTISDSQGSTGGILTYSVNAAGSGYVVGNILTVTGGSGTAQLTVTTVSGPGGILTLSLTKPGSGYSVTSGVSMTGGAGTLATVNILSIGTSTYASAVGVQAQGITATGFFSTSTVTTATAFQVVQNNLGSGPIVIGTQIGVDIPALTIASTNAYGLRIGKPTGGTSINNALNFLSDTVAAGGITFGTDTTLYRSGTRTLQSDAFITTPTFLVRNTLITGATTQVGVDVPTISVSLTNAYGIRIAKPTGGGTINNALNFVSDNTPAGGITFGTDANWYRFATGMIKSDTDITVRHIEHTNTALPMVAAGPGAGGVISLTVTAGSTDCKMQVTLVSAGALGVTGIIMTVTYNQPFTLTNPGVVFNSAASLGTFYDLYISSESTSSFDLSTATALSARTYVWNFQSC